VKRLALAPLAAALLLPAAASAQEPTLTTSVRDTLRGPAVLAGKSFTVRAVMRPYVEGETVTVRVYRAGKKIQVKRLTPKPVAGGAAGVATMKVRSRIARRLSITASHRATPALATLRAETLRVDVLSPYVGPGSRGPAVKLLQDGLAKLKYRVPRSGVYDSGTANAIMAWRKMMGMARTYVADAAVFNGVLKGRGKWKVRHPGDGRHVEALIGKQLLALVNGGRVERIYHTSSGAPATPTVLGKYRVYLKTPGTNAKGMVDSAYFIRGYAIHGYASVPPYNASHGCLRVPVQNAREIYDWLRIGDVVWVEP
jgi:peptidoglycan hydrolase-like protein with peptidoglycan-binding domain